MTNEYFYVVGDYSFGTGNENRNIISRFNLDTCEFTDTFAIGEANDNIRQIFFDADLNQIYASGNYIDKNTGRSTIHHDTAYIYDIHKQTFERIKLWNARGEGKEGYVGKIKYESTTGTIYLSSVYAEGGKPVLYAIDKNKKEVIKSIPVQSYGPQGLTLNSKKAVIYAMGTKSHAYIIEVNCRNNEILDKIDLPFEIHSVSPSSKVEMLIFDSLNDNLLVNVNHQLYQIILKRNREVIKLPYEQYHFINIAFSENSNRIYAITKRKIQNDAGNKIIHSLDMIKNGKIIQQFTSFKDLDFLHVLPNNLVCVSSVDNSNYPLSKRELHFLKETPVVN